MKFVSGQLDPIVRRLDTVSTLTPADTSTLGRLLTEATKFSAQATIVAEGQKGPPSFLLSGWVSRQRHLADGRRQIVSFVLPGDAIHSLMRPTLPAACGATALTSVLTVDASALLPVANDSTSNASSLSRALQLAERLDELLLRDQVVRLGVQSAYERMVHLFLEFYVRLRTVGCAEDGSFALPLNQEMLSNALGLSVVHVNRTLQKVRQDGLLKLRGGVLTILDEERMKDIADWSPLPVHQS